MLLDQAGGEYTAMVGVAMQCALCDTTRNCQKDSLACLGSLGEKGVVTCMCTELEQGCTVTHHLHEPACFPSDLLQRTKLHCRRLR